MYFRYVVYTEDGHLTEGKIDAATENLAKEMLRRSGYKLLSIKAAKSELSLSRLMPSLFGIKRQDTIAFSRQLATLIERGVPIISALQLLSNQTNNGAFREVLISMIQDIKQGYSLAEAVSRHPHAFPPIYKQMIRISEQTGNLESMLKQTANYMERQRAILKKTTRAMAYPTFILVLACIVVTIMVTFTLPPLIQMFEDLNAELPLITRAFLGIAGFFTSYKIQLAAAILGILVATVWYVRTPAGHSRLDKLLLRIPLIGRINTLREMSQLCRTMSVLLEAGLPMHEAMDSMVQTTRNVVIHEALETMRQEILKGNSISRSMASNPLFPPFLVQVAKVGEEAGTLGTDIMAVADSFEQEMDEKINNFVAVIEPAMLLAVGLVIGFIAVSVIMPIYSIMGSI